MIDRTNIMSPAEWAYIVSAGQWLPAKHLRIINTKLMEIAGGELTRLAVFLPPRHGKSELLSKYFPAWYLGHNPRERVILTSYESTFATSWGRKCRDLILRYGKSHFPDKIELSPDRSSASDWEIKGHGGGMITTGAGGAITGRGANLLIIDDPHKNAEEANSRTQRDNIWDWYTSTALTRLEPGGALILIQTRWHEDDLAGHILREARAEGGEQWEVISLPALAEPGDPLGRAPGQPLWPERFPVDELQKIKRVLGAYWWNALYQQRPVPPGGEVFKREWFHIVKDWPRAGKKVRFWDQAGTADGGDYTAGAFLCLHEGRLYIVDMVRGQWSPHNVVENVKLTAALDGKEIPIRIEQEGGSSGKQTIHTYVTSHLIGYDARGIKPLLSKELRANPVSALAQAGNLFLVEGPWNKAFIDEFTMFPRGENDDQVDAVSGGFQYLATAPRPLKVRAKSTQ